jgi:terminase large subunit-like protein
MSEALGAVAIERWRRDPAEFIGAVLRDPETREPFVLIEAEKRFLAHAFRTDDAGRLVYPEQAYAAPKKSGKTGFGAILTLTTTLIYGGPFAEGYCVANDLEQAQGRVYQAIRRIVEASPHLNRAARVTQSRVDFPETGASITAIASDYAGAAGANPTISVFDELWGYTSERSHRLWDEMVPPPTRKIACRLTVTYAGFEGESELLEGLYKRGLRQPRVGHDLYAGDGLLMFWTHEPVAPWQTEAWLAQMRGQLRPNAYLRLIENRWVTSESSFVDPDWLDACTDADGAPIVADKALPVWVGVDASVKRDSTAIVATTWDREAKKVRVIAHRIFQPSADDPLDFEATIEKTIRDFARRFSVREVRFDPYQMQAVAQRLARDGVRMVEFPQSVPNLTESSTNLYELVKGRGIVFYPDADIRLAFNRAIALEKTRGWRIAKEKTSHKIDVVVALAMAAHGAVHKGAASQEMTSAMLADGAAFPLPLKAAWIASVLCTDKQGRNAAVVYSGYDISITPPVLCLLDFDSGPMRGSIFADILQRIEELRAQCRAPGVVVFVPDDLQFHAAAAGLPTEKIPPEFLPEERLLSVASHVSAGRVRACGPALERARNSPFAASLDFGLGENTDDPLRAALVLVIALGLDSTGGRIAA